MRNASTWSFRRNCDVGSSDMLRQIRFKVYEHDAAMWCRLVLDSCCVYQEKWGGGLGELRPKWFSSLWVRNKITQMMLFSDVEWLRGWPFFGSCHVYMFILGGPGPRVWTRTQSDQALGLHCKRATWGVEHKHCFQSANLRQPAFRQHNLTTKPTCSCLESHMRCNLQCKQPNAKFMVGIGTCFNIFHMFYAFLDMKDQQLQKWWIRNLTCVMKAAFVKFRFTASSLHILTRHVRFLKLWKYSQLIGNAATLRQKLVLAQRTARLRYGLCAWYIWAVYSVRRNLRIGRGSNLASWADDQGGEFNTYWMTHYGIILVYVTMVLHKDFTWFCTTKPAQPIYKMVVLDFQAS